MRPVKDQVDNENYDWVWDRGMYMISDQVEDQVRNQVSRQVKDQVYIWIKNKINEELSCKR